MCGFPDYANMSLLFTTGQTGNKEIIDNGWVCMYVGTEASTSTDNAKLTINNKYIAEMFVASQQYERHSVMCPVSSGDILTMTKDINFPGWYDVWFIPIK